MKDARYMDVSGAMALLNFIEQSDKSGLSVTLEQVPAHIKKTLVVMASNEQKDKLLFVKRKLYEETPLYKGVFVVCNICISRCYVSVDIYSS